MTPLKCMEKDTRKKLTPLLADGAADGTAAVLSLLEQMPILQYDTICPKTSQRGAPFDLRFLALFLLLRRVGGYLLLRPGSSGYYMICLVPVIYFSSFNLMTQISENSETWAVPTQNLLLCHPRTAICTSMMRLFRRQGRQTGDGTPVFTSHQQLLPNRSRRPKLAQSIIDQQPDSP